MDHNFDVLIIGGGLSGTAALSRLAFEEPEWRLALLEKETDLGGRAKLRSTGHPGCFPAVNEELALFLLRSLEPFLVEDWSIFEKPLDLAAILIHGQQHRLPSSLRLQPEGVRRWHGTAAAQLWSEFLAHIATIPDASLMLSKAGGEWKRHPAFKQLIRAAAPLCGCTDLWQETVAGFRKRLTYAEEKRRTIDWHGLLTAAFASLGSRVQVHRSTSALRARREKHKTTERWYVDTPQGCFYADRLLIACSPWEVQTWLEDAPQELTRLAFKTSPLSSVLLTLHFAEKTDVAAEGLIAAEDCLFFRYNNSLCLQTFISFEESLNAPAVSLALRRLRRGAKKWSAQHALNLPAADAVALIPVAWIAETATLPQTSTLAFCGDAYAKNLHSSILDACAALRNLPG